MSFFSNNTNTNNSGKVSLSGDSLLRGLERGEETAFRVLFDTWYQRLVSFAYRYTGDLDSAREVVQDVFVILFDKRDEIRIHTSLKSHLFQSVRNRALNMVKHEKMKRTHHARIASDAEDSSISHDTLEMSDLEARIALVVNGLPEQCQKIFRMSRQKGLPNQEIADLLSISKRTVETQISKALRRLRQDLKEQGMLQWWMFIASSTLLSFLESF